MALLSKQKIFYLLEAYTSGKASPDEEEMLFKWINDREDATELKEYLFAVWNRRVEETFAYVDWQAMYKRIIPQPTVAGKVEEEHVKVKKEVHGWKKIALAPAFRWVAAAVILLGMATGAFYLLLHSESPVRGTARNEGISIPAPIGTKAILTLADGSIVQLNSVSTGTVAMQGGTKIVKDKKGTISYNGKSEESIGYNRLEVPKGSLPLQLSFSDGSKVWLNVGSSLRYPTVFTGKERKVEITGEAYFEVAHNEKMPFVVQEGTVSVQVLGTHFDVNGYTDESVLSVTLLQGAVKVTNGHSQAFIRPGEQARVAGSIEVRQGVDMEEVMAWKEGKFKFGEEADINSIMRQIARWYNVDILYEGQITQHFWGTVSRSANLSDVLKILEATGSAHFKLEGNTIVVVPAS